MDTSLSLLDLLRSQPNADAWRRLVELYTPLIRGWLARHAAAPADFEDVVQEVFAVLVRRLPEFQRAPRTGAFRHWLKQITVNCLRDAWRSRRGKPGGTGDSDFLAMLEQMEDPRSGLSRVWDEEHDRHVLRGLLQLIRTQFEPRTWRAFERVAIDGATPAEVAAELGISVNAVFIAKSRVLASLRQIGAGLID